MKFLFYTLMAIFLLSQNVASYSQSLSENEFKKRVIGKTLTGNGVTMKFNKDGTFRGTLARNGSINQINGNWSYTKSKGYCRSLTIMIAASGKMLNRPPECQPFIFLANNKVKANNILYSLK